MNYHDFYLGCRDGILTADAFDAALMSFSPIQRVRFTQHQIAPAIMWCCKTGDLERLQAFIRDHQAQEQLVACQCEATNIAVQSGHLAILKWLLEDASLDCAQTLRSPARAHTLVGLLNVAMKEEHLEILDYLYFEFGAIQLVAKKLSETDLEKINHRISTSTFRAYALSCFGLDLPDAETNREIAAAILAAGPPVNKELRELLDSFDVSECHRKVYYLSEVCRRASKTGMIAKKEDLDMLVRSSPSLKQRKV